jgi:glyoxylase I family protein
LATGGVTPRSHQNAITTEEQDMTAIETLTKTDKTGVPATPERELALSFHGVRYQVGDVVHSVDFYKRVLGFKVEHQHLPEFATVSLGALQIHLSGPGASGSRPMANGRRQEPGGWNRVVLGVTDLETVIEILKKAGIRFRNAMETGPGGKQLQLEDPDGNPIELFEPARATR